MKNKILFVAAFCAIAAVSFFLGRLSISSGSGVRYENGVLPSSSTGKNFALSENDLQKKREDASRGDMDAMRQIYYHYEFDKEDHVEAKKWQSKMADAGDLFSQESLMRDYLKSDDFGFREVGAERCKEWLSSPRRR